MYDQDCRDIISPLLNVGALRQKGVTQEQIDEAIEAIDDESEYRAAFDLAFKKFNTMSRLEPDVQVRRIQSLLQRKGFGFSVISRVLKELDLLNS